MRQCDPRGALGGGRGVVQSDPSELDRGGRGLQKFAEIMGGGGGGGGGGWGGGGGGFSMLRRVSCLWAGVRVSRGYPRSGRWAGIDLWAVAVGGLVRGAGLCGVPGPERGSAGGFAARGLRSWVARRSDSLGGHHETHFPAFRYPSQGAHPGWVSRGGGGGGEGKGRRERAHEDPCRPRRPERPPRQGPQAPGRLISLPGHGAFGAVLE